LKLRGKAWQRPEQAIRKKHTLADRGRNLRGGPMARTLREVIAAAPAERRAKIAAAHRQKIVAEEQKLIVVAKKRQLQETKRVMELDSNLIAIAAIITALPIVAALAWMLTALAVGHGAH